MSAARTRWLLACGAVAGPLFTVVYLVVGAMRDGYNPLRHPVSSLQLGQGGWTQVVNFIVAGVLSLAFSVGLWRALRPLGGSTVGPVLVGAFAVGLIGSGVFITDPVSGYPPGTPDAPTEYSTSGALHDLFALLTFLGLPVACLVLAGRFAGWGRRGWAVYSAVTGLVFLAGLFFTNRAFAQVEGLVAFGGLFQRATVTVGWCWLALLAVHLRRALPGRRSPAGA